MRREVSKMTILSRLEIESERSQKQDQDLVKNARVRIRRTIRVLMMKYNDHDRP